MSTTLYLIGVATVWAVFIFVASHHVWIPKLLRRLRSPDIQDARDVTYELVEVSMAEDPKAWRVVRGPTGNPVWLTNSKAGLAVMVSRGSDGLHLVKQKDWPKKGALLDDKKRMQPSAAWKARLWLASSKLISDEDERREMDDLREMVAGFQRLAEQRRGNQ